MILLFKMFKCIKKYKKQQTRMFWVATLKTFLHILSSKLLQKEGDFLYNQGEVLFSLYLNFFSFPYFFSCMYHMYSRELESLPLEVNQTISVSINLPFLDISNQWNYTICVLLSGFFYLANVFEVGPWHMTGFGSLFLSLLREVHQWI